MDMGVGMGMATRMQSQQTDRQTNKAKQTNKQASRQSGNAMTWGVCMYVPSLGYPPCKKRKKKRWHLLLPLFLSLFLSDSLSLSVNEKNNKTYDRAKNKTKAKQESKIKHINKQNSNPSTRMDHLLLFCCEGKKVVVDCFLSSKPYFFILLTSLSVVSISVASRRVSY